LHLGLGQPGKVRVLACDLNPSVLAHIESLAGQARAGRPYVVQLPKDSRNEWSSGLVSYWQHFGELLGSPTRPLEPPGYLKGVEVRAVSIRPQVAAQMAGQDLDIVAQQLEVPPDDTFQQVWRGDPKYSEVNFYLGLSYFGLDQYDKAIAAFDKQLEIDPKYRRAHYFEAQVFQSLNRNADAMRQYEILLAQDPNDKKSLYQLIRFLKSTTLQAIDQLANLDQNSVYTLVLRLELAVPADPNFMKGYFLLGKCYAAQGRLPEALKLLEKAASMDPDDKNVHYQLAQICMKLNEPAKSHEQMQIFQKLYAQEREKKAQRLDEKQKEMARPSE